jgi:hypothetical protein
VPPTKKKVEIDIVVVAQFRGDRLACERIYWDQATVLRQVGLLREQTCGNAGQPTPSKDISAAFGLASRLVLFIYFLLVVSAAALAVARLSESTEMPGLQAIELVLLALPWSFALAVEPLSHLGSTPMAIMIVTGVALNALSLQRLVRFFDRCRTHTPV